MAIKSQILEQPADKMTEREVSDAIFAQWIFKWNNKQIERIEQSSEDWIEWQ